MTTPDGSTGPSQERPAADTERPGRHVPDVGRGTGAGAATTPGLVVTEERLADGRRITYYGTSA